MSDAKLEFVRAKIDLGQRLGLALEDASVVNNLQDRYRRHLKQQVAPGSNVSLAVAEGARAVLEQIRYGHNPVQNIIEVALNGKDGATRAQAEGTLRMISSLPDVRPTSNVTNQRSFEIPKFP